jgi:hypothetical protein
MAKRVLLFCSAAMLLAGAAVCEKPDRAPEVPPLDRTAAGPPAAVESPAARASSELGVALQTLSPGLARAVGLALDQHGALVAQVEPNGMAVRLGLAVGDVIVEVDGQPVRSAQEAVALMRVNGEKPSWLRTTNTKGSRFIRLAAGGAHAWQIGETYF